MIKKMDKVTSFFKQNKKTFSFLVTIAVVGLISGICFYFLLSTDDKTNALEIINNYIENIKNNNFSTHFSTNFLFNLILLIIMYISGISIIGFFLCTLMYFIKNFAVGLFVTLLTKTSTYFTVPLLYLFPAQLINIALFTVLLYFSLSISLELLFYLVKGRIFNFKNVGKRYSLIFLIIIGILLLTTLYETYILPKMLLYFL